MGDAEDRFKLESQKAWVANANYWLNNPLRQVEDTKSFFKGKLRELVAPNMSIVDMGCGSGWLFEFLLELSVPFSYTGLDFTHAFISHLHRKFATHANASFELTDFEQAVPSALIGKADIVFNCFAFFEVLKLEQAFHNAVRMLKPGGHLVVFTIDPVFLMLAVSRTMEQFREKLALYEKMKSRGETLHFFQNIDLGDSESTELKYPSVLYSIDDFCQQAKRNSLRIVDYGEVVMTAKFLPKIYQYALFSQR